MKYLRGLFVGIFFCFIVLMGQATLDNKNERSLTEGRALKQFPGVKYSRFMDVDYLNSISDAFSDQIAGREKWISAYYQLMVDRLHQKWVGQISIGKEGQLYQEPEVIQDWEQCEREIIQFTQDVNRQAKKAVEAGAVFVYINYPRKDVVMTDDLPDYYPDSRRDYRRVIKMIKSHLSEDVVFIDALDLLKGQGQVYYSTDHHVNFHGQMAVYRKLMSLVQERFPGVKIWQEDDFVQKKRVVDGSYNRRIAYAVRGKKEALEVKPRKKISYKRENSKVGLFRKGNTYASVYMGGDYADTLVTVKEKEGLQDAPSVFISGSSYTNSLEALCVGSFSRMHSVDFRMNNTGKTVAEYVQEEKPDYVVYIPDQSNSHFSLVNFRLHLGIK